MIQSFCTVLRRDLNEAVESRLAELERGRGSREADEKLRGELFGLRYAIESVSALEERARRNEDSDDML
jgi:hypothetical protein